MPTVATAEEITAAAIDQPWRVGGARGAECTIFADTGETYPPMVGMMLTPALAADAVLCHNRLVEQDRRTLGR